MTKKLLLTLGLAAGLSTAQGQVSFTSTTFSYSENFDGLINTDGDSATFTDNSTISGWYVNSEEMDSNSDEYFASIGSSNGGEVYSFGADGDSDRALGYVGSGGNDYFNAAVRLVNNSGSTIDQVDIAYTGEQWRSGGDSSDNQNFLNFSYQIFAAGGGSIPADTSLTGWTEENTLDFSAPQPNVAAGALDGNLAANSESLSASLTGLSWADGEELWVRFTGDNGAGSDAGLGVDNFSATAVPEASATFAVLGVFGLVALRRRRA